MEWYHDKPYKTSIPKSDEYFDHSKIDLCGHKLGPAKISIVNELKKTYGSDKKLFYEQLQKHFSTDRVIEELNYFLSILPADIVRRRPIFEELVVDFREKKWFSFYALGLTQIEGLFSEMTKSTTIASKKSNASLPEKVEMVRPFYEFSQSGFDYYQYHIPILRNKFLHYGLDEDIEIKCFDILYDLRHLLEVYIDLKTPLLELNKLMKRRNTDDFHEVAGFNYYFDLLKALRDASQLSQIQNDIEAFEKDFLVPQTDIENLSVELVQLVPQAFAHWYSTIAMFTESNTVKLDMKTITSHMLEQNKEEYIERIKPVFKSYQDIFDNLMVYHNFLKRYKSNLPTLSVEISSQLENLYKAHESDFNKLLFFKNNIPKDY